MAQSWNGQLPAVMANGGKTNTIPVLDVNQFLPATETTQTTTPTEAPAPTEPTQN